ncbi:MAG: hypothetical protein U5L45_26670 [Saprospiraceae bacterium]|nr:hypothetical protein [Saprospiraceae bacterium]
MFILEISEVSSKYQNQQKKPSPKGNGFFVKNTGSLTILAAAKELPQQITPLGLFATHLAAASKVVK